MKNIIITLSILLTISFFTFASIYNVHQDVRKAAKQTKLIHQSYTVSAVHDTYIEAQSDKYPNEYINFYYTDQKEPEHFNIKDKIIAYFQPYKHSFQIVDFKKVSPKLIKQTFTITFISNGQYQAVNNTKGTDKARLLFNQSDIKSSHSVSVGDTISVFYNDLPGEDQFLYVK